MALSIVACNATAPDKIAVTFSDPVDPGTATTPGNYQVGFLTGPNQGTSVTLDQATAQINLDPSGPIAVITLVQPGAAGGAAPAGVTLTPGQWIELTVNNVTPAGGGPLIANTGNNVFCTRVDGVGGQLGDIVRNTGKIATNTGTIATNTVNTAQGVTTGGQAVDDIASFSLLTEEIGYPPSPLAAPSGGGGGAAAGMGLGQMVGRAISDVLGWKLKTDDPKAFVGALTASFPCKEVEGHTQCTWVPRTYAVQTDLSGGITGAQASIFARAKDALDQSLPLLDGLYPLFEEAKPEDVAALRATVRSQMTDLVSELGLVGGPRIIRVNQLFFLLLGQPLPSSAPVLPTFQLQTDPDLVGGSLGNLRDEFGFSTDDDLVNTVEDEQDVTNFRIVSDYMTSLAQSWVNNLQFFGLATKTPFFGTQLVLISRQLSVVAESVNEVRFALDSVFIGPAERQSLQIDFPPDASGQTPPSMFLEDLLSWVYSFASDEGPRLVQDGGKFAVGQSFVPIGEQLQTLVQGAENPANVAQLPRGYKTARVRRALEKLADQLQGMVDLASPIQHVITPEPEPALSILGANPNTGKVGTTVNVLITGTGFESNASANFGLSAPGGSVGVLFLSANRLFATVTIAAAEQPGIRDIKVTNPDQKKSTLGGGFTITP